MLGKMTVQADVTNDLARIRGRCVGQQYLGAGKTMKQSSKASLGANHLGQVIEAMRITQKFVSPHCVMTHHAEQCGAIALPVGHAYRIDGFGMRGLLFGFQHPRYRGIHVVIDRRENRMRRIMQRIV
jgi:hypothetical protein